VAAPDTTKNRPAPAAKPKKLARWRRITIWVLLVLATLVAILSTLTLWAKRQALETTPWVNTSSELLANDEIRGALSTYLVNELYANVDVTARLEQRLPKDLQGLAAPLAGGLREVATRAANELLQRPRVQALWREANKKMHERLIAVIEGDAKRISVQGENVVLDLRPFLGQLEEQFGLTAKLPPDAGKLVIMKADQLDTVRKLASWLRALSVFIVIALLVLYGLAIFLAPGRRRETLRAAGISLIVAGVALLVIRRLVENHVVDALVSNEVARAPAKQVWLIGTSLLSDIAWNGIAYGLVAVAAAWLAGPTRPATWIRRRLAPTFRDQPYVPFVIAGVLYLLLLLWGPTRAQREWIWILVLAAILALGTEMYRRITIAEPVEETPGRPSPTPAPQ
jgi:hypothetical protein